MSSSRTRSQAIRHRYVLGLLLVPLTAFAALAQTLAQTQPQPQTQTSNTSQPALPGAPELRARALDSFHQSEAARERYICRERIQNDELDASGRLKKTTLVEREIFYVNGFQISQEVSKDGKPLSPGDLKKRDEAVRKAIESASDHRKPKESGLVLNAGDILRLASLQNERRILVAGRPTIVFDVVPDPSAKASTIEEKLVAAMAGTVSIDESTGNLQDVNTRGMHDIKLGGGLVANVHKGFAVHILVAPQPDGVWLLTLAEGTGDARVGLLVRSALRFRQETEGCKLYDVSTTQSTETPTRSTPSPK